MIIILTEGLDKYICLELGLKQHRYFMIDFLLLALTAFANYFI